jgi:hypothetical protein
MDSQFRKIFCTLCVKKKGNFCGCPDSKIRTEPHPVDYLSKKLDGTAIGWPGCLRAIDLLVLLVEEATKITLGQQLEVLSSIRSQPPRIEKLLLDVQE